MINNTENSPALKEIEVIRSDRRTIAIQIKKDMKILIRAPLCLSDEEIRKFVEEKRPWIQKHLKKAKQQDREKESPFSESELQELADAAKHDFLRRVEKYESVIGVRATGITIRCQRTRWGSCSSKGKLSFNCLLMLCPEEVRNYVAVHELCHLKEMNHSRNFWALVERILPDYRQQRRWLREYGDRIIMRIEK